MSDDAPPKVWAAYYAALGKFIHIFARAQNDLNVAIYNFVEGRVVTNKKSDHSSSGDPARPENGQAPCYLKALFTRRADAATKQRSGRHSHTRRRLWYLTTVTA